MLLKNTKKIIGGLSGLLLLNVVFGETVTPPPAINSAPPVINQSSSSIMPGSQTVTPPPAVNSAPPVLNQSSSSMMPGSQTVTPPPAVNSAPPVVDPSNENSPSDLTNSGNVQSIPNELLNSLSGSNGILSQDISLIIDKINSFSGDSEAAKVFGKEIVLSKKNMLTKMNLPVNMTGLKEEYKNIYGILIAGQKNLLIIYFEKVNQDNPFIVNPISVELISTIVLDSSSSQSMTGDVVPMLTGQDFTPPPAPLAPVETTTPIDMNTYYMIGGGVLLLILLVILIIQRKKKS